MVTYSCPRVVSTTPRLDACLPPESHARFYGTELGSGKQFIKIYPSVRRKRNWIRPGNCNARQMNHQPTQATAVH